MQTYSSSANGGVGTASVPTSSTRREGEDGELVDGWPKWLIDNIPRDALEGLIPRSAETYDKIDKVSFSAICFWFTYAPIWRISYLIASFD